VIVDANILLYAVDRSSPFHAVARDWLEDALNGDQRVGLPWQSLTAFLRIVTHPRAALNPMTPVEAWSTVESWLEAEPAWIPLPTPRHANVLGNLVKTHHIRGNLVTDASLAALAIENGVKVCSADSDFGRFPEAEWFNPLFAT